MDYAQCGEGLGELTFNMGLDGNGGNERECEVEDIFFSPAVVAAEKSSHRRSVMVARWQR